MSDEPAPDPGKWLRVALFRRYGADRMMAGGFVLERGELRLLLLAVERLSTAREVGL